MLSFNQFITEKVINIFKPEHEKFREQYRNDIHDIIQKSYARATKDGYLGLGSGTPEESAQIHKDISNLNIKAVKRDGKITAVNMYKDQFGRKSVATGHDGTVQGKKDWKQLASEDIHQTDRYVWGEVSGGSEAAKKKLGAKEIPFEKMGGLIGKSMQRVGDTNRYVRDIGGEPHEKVGIGNPKYEG